MERSETITLGILVVPVKVKLFLKNLRVRYAANLGKFVL